MDPGKMVTIQHQMRQNQEEFNEYVKGLESWADDMKTKEEKRKSADTETPEVDLPPVRNSLLKKKKKKKLKENSEKNNGGESASTKKKKINAYDYRAWDRFDADAAAEEIDKSEDIPKDEDEYETDEEWEEQRRVLLAKEEKEKGNAHFKAGRWDAAVENYTTAIRLDPTNPLLYTNRAMAQIRAQRLAAAESDCTTALGLEPQNTKALYRRGLARKGLGKGHEAEALADFEKLLTLDPNSKAAQAEVEALEKIVRPTGEVKAVHKAPSERSKKPLRRIQIEEVGFAESRSSGASRAADPALGEFLKERSTTKLPPPAPAPTAPTPADPLPLPPPALAEEPQASLRENTSSGPPAAAPTAPTSSGGPRLDGDSAAASPVAYPPPRTFRQFESAFANLAHRGDRAALDAYLRAVPPSDYARVFGQCLEPRHLGALVGALAGAEGAVAKAGLLALRRVPRFGFLAMMVGRGEQETVLELRRRLVDSGDLSAVEAKQLGTDFRL